MSLPAIIQASVGKMNDLYEKMVTHSQALDTTGKLEQIDRYIGFNGYNDSCRFGSNRQWLARMKLLAIYRGLRKWTGRNPIHLKDK